MDIELLKTIVKNSETINEVLTKMGKNTSAASYKVFKKYVNKNCIDTSHFLNQSEVVKKLFKNGKLKKNNNNVIFIENSRVGRQTTKNRIISDNLIDYRCVFCGNNGEWLGKKITLILDHINGVNNDNRLENLRFVCPNCNSTLDTHCRGFIGVIKLNEKKEKKVIKRVYKPRPHKRKVERPPIDVLKQQIKDLGYVRTGKLYGVSDNAIRKWVNNRS
jgi:hypothetical protein